MERKEMITMDVTIPAVRVTVEKGSDKEVVKAAKEAVIAELEKSFPTSKFIIVEEGELRHEDIKVGMIVEYCEDSKLRGIVLKVNKSTVNVVFTNNRVLRGPASSFRLSDISFEDAGTFKDDKFLHTYTPYDIGLSGYFNNAGDVIPVIITENKNGKYKIYSIENPGSYYSLTKEQMDKFFDGKRKEKKEK